MSALRLLNIVCGTALTAFSVGVLLVAACTALSTV